MCIKLVSIKELYYDARPTKSQDHPDCLQLDPAAGDRTSLRISATHP